MCSCLSYSQEEFLCLCWNPGAAEPGAGPGQCPSLCRYHRRTVVCMLGGRAAAQSLTLCLCPLTLPVSRKHTSMMFLRKNKVVGSVSCQKSSKSSGSLKQGGLWSACSGLEVVRETSHLTPLMPGHWLVS